MGYPGLEGVTDPVGRVRHDVVGAAGGVPARGLHVAPELPHLLPGGAAEPGEDREFPPAQPSVTIRASAANCSASAQPMSTSPGASGRSAAGLKTWRCVAASRSANTMTPVRS